MESKEGGLSMLNLCVTMNDGITYYGSNPYEIIQQLKICDWEIPTTNLEFKIGMAQRCTVAGVTLAFWDETSFLFALQEAGFCEITIGVEKYAKKK